MFGLQNSSSIHGQVSHRAGLMDIRLRLGLYIRRNFDITGLLVFQNRISHVYTGNF